MGESNRIDREAAAWVARFDRGSEGSARDAARDAEWEAWINGDRRRLGAYVRAEAAWRAMDRAGVLPTPVVQAPRLPRRLLIGGGLAAAAAAVAGAVVLTPRATRYDAGPREIRHVQLADGSTASINSESEIEVSMTKALRRVKLLRGDAWFQVAKDPDRPFLVESGNMTVRAVGTAFSVLRGEGLTDVMVSEGVVELRPRDKAVAPLRMAAGSKAAFRTGGPLESRAVALAQVEAALAWREAQIALNGETLRTAADKFNRYNRRQLVIADPGLAEETFVGWFRMDDPQSFAEVVATALNARTELQGDRIILARRREAASN